MSVSSQQPISSDGASGCASWPLFLHLSGGYEGDNDACGLLSRQVLRHTLCPHRDVGGEPRLGAVSQRLFCPMFSPAASRHAHWLRSRLSLSGFHARPREGFALSHFFPRSVGFGPTVSRANGAFTVAPSMLCHAQAMPSISSYSASPRRHIAVKTPRRFHSRKYLCTELALPNSFGIAFHWHPVRRTYTIASKTFRGDIGLRPPPGRLLYFLPFSRFLFGINGATFSQRTSDTVHDFIALMHYIVHPTRPSCQC